MSQRTIPVTDFDPPVAGRERTMRDGMIATGLAQGVRVACQFASVVILSRLLAPGDFGLLAMCAPVLALAALFQDLGLTTATIQRPKITRAEVNFLFWVSVAAAAGLGLVMAASAPLIALFYGEPRVAPLVAALAVPIAIYGLASQHYALLNRRMRFGTLAAIDASSAVAGLLASLVWALAVEASVWALYAGSLTTALVPTIAFWTLSDWRPGPVRTVEGARGLVRFGADVTGFRLANFVARNGDNVLIGRVWGEVPLGYYDRAYKLLLFPLQQINTPVSKVMLPALSRLTEAPTEYRGTYLRAVSLIALITVPGVLFLGAAAPLVVSVVLGERWAPVAPIFAALAFAGLLQPINASAGWLLVSQGRTDAYMRWGVVTAVTSLIAFAIGLPYGPFGVAVAYAVSEYLRTPFLWLYVGRTGPVGASTVALTCLPVAAGAGMALLVVPAALPLVPGGPVAALIGSAALCYAVVLAVVALFPQGRETLRWCVGIARSIVAPHPQRAVGPGAAK